MQKENEKNVRTESDLTDSKQDNSVCWQRSTHILPRIKIATETKEYLIPWVHIAFAETDHSYRVITLHTSLGMAFLITSAIPLKDLYSSLQSERVQNIYPIAGITVSIKTAQV